MVPALKLCVVFGAISAGLGSVITSNQQSGAFELLILHNNDMHARFEQTSQLSGICSKADREAGKCYGGFPRVAHVVKEARKAAATGQGPPVLYLNAGDTYTGTAWFTIYKWKIAAECINALKPDAVSLSNDGLDPGTRQYVRSLNSPILAANIQINPKTNETIHKSAIFNINGVKVGIIGYIKPKYNFLLNPNAVYDEEVEALQKEVENLKKYDVNILIALGHSFNDKHIEIAKKVKGLDVVIAGQEKLSELSDYNLIKQDSGSEEVLVVNSYDFSKYLGNTKLTFNKNRTLIKFNSQKILLDETVSQDKDAIELVNYLTNDVVGKTAVVLDGETCNTGECNLGNLIADAIIYQQAIRNTEERWNDAPASIIRSSAIKSSINPSNRPADITMNDLYKVFPKPETIVAVMTPGPTIIKLLEESVADLNKNDPTDLFLQHSGLRVTYDLSRPPGSRVINVMVRCCSCTMPQYFNIHGRSYNLLMQKSMSQHKLLAGIEPVELPYDDITCLKEYIKRRSPVYPDVIGRNSFRDTSDDVVGKTAVVLDGETCNTGECNLGNLITDAIIYQQAIRNTEERWNDAPASIIRSGAIKASISPSIRPGDITVNDLFKVFPKPEKIVAVMTPGPTIIKLLEESVADLNENEPTDLFLQHSGLRVTYDLSRPPGSRVINVMVRCCSCTMPQYFNIHGRSYNLLMQKSMSQHELLADLEPVELPYDDITCLRQYIEDRSPVYPDVIGRNTFVESVDDEDDNDGHDTTERTTSTTNITPTTDSSSALKSSFILLLVTYIFLQIK